MNQSRELCADPWCYAEQEKQRWQEVWQHHQQEALQTEGLQQAPQLPDLTLEGFDAAVARFKEDTAIGTDQFAPRWLWQLSK